MWSRFVLPINRHVAHKSLNSILNGNLSLLPLHRFKHVAVGDKREKPNRSDNGKLNENREQLQAKKGIMFATNDAEVFGVFERHVTEPEKIDAGDIADEEHYSTIPLRRDQLPQRRYEDMIKKHLRNKQFKEAIDILEVRMKEDRVKPDYYIYELLIIECGRYGFTKKAFKLYNHMKKRGLRVSGPIYAALFNACANTIHPNEGLKLAENLRKIIIQTGYEPNGIIYNAMIKAFGRCGDITTAFQLVDEMKEKKLTMKIDTMNHLLQVCCSEQEFGFRHALIVWQKIHRRNLEPTVHSFNLMLRCTRDCGFGDIQEMKTAIGTILRGSQQQVKLKASKATKPIQLIAEKPIITINNTTSDENYLTWENNDQRPQNQTGDGSKELCDQMPNLLSKLPHLGSIVQLELVNTPEERFMLLGGLTAFISEMEAFKVRPNVKTFSQMLDTIPSTREAEHELIQKMRYMRVRADVDFFNLLMKRRVLRKDHEGAKQVLELIEKVNLKPDIVTYGVMAMGCVDRHQAKQFHQDLSEKGVRLNNEILGALLKNATYAKDYDYVIDVISYAMNEDLKPSSKFVEILSKFKNSRFYSLQSNDDDQEQIKYNKFYTVYKKWREQMALDGLSRDAATKFVNVHPWKQLKETEGKGIEDLKNKRTRRYWKVQHTLEKLTSTRLDRMQTQNPEKFENIQNVEHNESK